MKDNTSSARIATLPLRLRLRFEVEIDQAQGLSYPAMERQGGKA